MGTGCKEITLKIRVVEAPQRVQDQGIRIQIQDAVQLMGQQQGRRQAVVDLFRITVRHREAVEHAAGHRQEPEFHTRKVPGQIFPDQRIQVGMQEKDPVMGRTTIFRNGPQTNRQLAQRPAVDAKQQIHVVLPPFWVTALCYILFP